MLDRKKSFNCLCESECAFEQKYSIFLTFDTSSSLRINRHLCDGFNIFIFKVFIVDLIFKKKKIFRLSSNENPSQKCRIKILYKTFSSTWDILLTLQGLFQQKVTNKWQGYFKNIFFVKFKTLFLIIFISRLWVFW